jgi:polar amino acid transport system substrate-binding protein
MVLFPHLMKKTFPLLIALILLSLRGISETITIAADPWLPYTGEQKKGKQGYLIEIAQMIFESQGIHIEYQTMPWARSVEQARKGTIQAIAGAYKTDAPDFIFTQKPQGHLKEFFYVLKANPWRYQTLASLESISLGVINGYSYGETLDRYIEKNKDNPKRIQSISGENALSINLGKLQKKRIDALIEGKTVLDHHLKDQSLPIELTEAGLNATHDIYIAFSPHDIHSKKYVTILEEGVQKLRASGKLKIILDSYGVSDWTP